MLNNIMTEPGLIGAEARPQTDIEISLRETARLLGGVVAEVDLAKSLGDSIDEELRIRLASMAGYVVAKAREIEAHLDMSSGPRDDHHVPESTDDHSLDRTRAVDDHLDSALPVMPPAAATAPPSENGRGPLSASTPPRSNFGEPEEPSIDDGPSEAAEEQLSPLEKYTGSLFPITREAKIGDSPDIIILDDTTIRIGSNTTLKLKPSEVMVINILFERDKFGLAAVRARFEEATTVELQEFQASLHRVRNKLAAQLQDPIKTYGSKAKMQYRLEDRVVVADARQSARARTAPDFLVRSRTN